MQPTEAILMLKDDEKLSEIPDYEAGRQWDEWFSSFTKEQMRAMFEADTVRVEFNKWLSSRNTKH
jgi:hypothetical protein